ncbi:MAG: zinc ABC transporter solute-binding protein [Halanaerobiaceae bacterium]|nr:zinc ABC transporter solute-binding protein [Halanaerobiaceae bacterium]
MRKNTIWLLLILSSILIIVLFYIFAGEEEVLREEDGPAYSIYTSIFPIYELARSIAGEDNMVQLVVPSGAELHSYEPSPRRLAGLEQADIFFYIGLDLEPWAEGMARLLNNSGVRTVELSAYLPLLRIEETGVEEDHYDDYHHGVYDPHVWLDPENMKTMAAVIRDELIILDPEKGERYKANYESYAGKIDELLAEYDEVLRKLNQDTIIVSHAAFGYLARRYNFRQLSVSSLAPHGEPTPGNLARIVDTAREKKLKYIFLEPHLDRKMVEVIAREAGLEILVLNPFIGLTEDERENNEDYFSIMYKNLENLKKALVDADG